MQTKELDKYILSGKSLKTKADLCLKMVSPTGIEPVTISLKAIGIVNYIYLINTVIYLKTYVNPMFSNKETKEY